jgi:multidrug resistance protein MdtO
VFFNSLWAEAQFWLRYLRRDLSPTPGRLESSLRITLTTVLVLVAMMVLQVPFVAYGLYAIFMVGRESPTVTLRTGIASSCVVACAVGIATIVVILTDNNPMARVLSLSVITFLAAMIFVASSLPALGPGWGLIFGVVINFWEGHSPADTIVKNSLWLLAAFVTGFSASILVEHFLATRSPAAKLAEQLRLRYRALQSLFSAFAQDSALEDRTISAGRVSRLAGAGASGMFALYNQMVGHDLDRGNLPIAVHVHINFLASLLDNAAAFGLQASALDSTARARCEVLAKQCAQLSETLRPGPGVNVQATPDVVALTQLDRIEAIMRSLQSLPAAPAESRPSLVAIPAKRVPLLLPGAFSQTENLTFAFKISICATLCYILYHAVGWPGISTSVVTVMAGGLIDTGGMKQRLAFRLSAVIVGGLILGIGSDVFLFPLMDSITSLIVLIGAVAFGCAWVAGGSRFGYFGMQISFAFYITSIEGFSAPTELAPARDRFVGVLAAMLVMWFIFDQIWPVRSLTTMRRAVASALRDSAQVVSLIDSTLSFGEKQKEFENFRGRLSRQLSKIRELNDATEFEYGADQAKHMQSGHTLVQLSMSTIALVFNHLTLFYSKEEIETVLRPPLVQLRQEIRRRLSILADALGNNQSLAQLRLEAIREADITSSGEASEYSRNTIWRFNEIQALALSLQPVAD